MEEIKEPTVEAPVEAAPETVAPAIEETTAPVAEEETGADSAPADAEIRTVEGE